MGSAPQQDGHAEGVVDRAANGFHQDLRREVNEQIHTINERFDVATQGTMEVMCECARAGCTGWIVMTMSEYDAVRRFPTRSLIKKGHRVSEVERAVAESAGYIVVERFGDDDLYTVAGDPRRPARHGNGTSNG